MLQIRIPVFGLSNVVSDVQLHGRNIVPTCNCIARPSSWPWNDGWGQ